MEGEVLRLRERELMPIYEVRRDRFVLAQVVVEADDEEHAREKAWAMFVDDANRLSPDDFEAKEQPHHA